MKVRIDIDTRTFVRFWLVVIGFALALLAIYSARTALIIIGVALFLALALNAPVSKIAGHLPGRSRVGATALAFVVVVALLSAVVTLVIPPIIEQSAKFAQTIPSIVDDAGTRWQGLNSFIDSHNLRPQVDSALNSIKQNASGWAANAGGTLLTSVGSLASTLTATLLALVLSFLMLVEGPMWLRRLWGVYNDQDRMEYHKKLLHRMYSVVTGYVTGQLTVSAIGAAAAGLAVFILSFIFKEVPANLAMPTAAITFVLSLIPMFGATIGGLIITALLAFNNLTAAIIYVIFFVLYQQIENNFVSPHIQAKKIDLSALAVLASVTIGLYVFGVAGGIIAIPIAGCVRVLVEDYLERAKKNRIESDKPLSKLVKKIKGEEAA
jgi:predicted PurR-regulated permease PerM